MEATMMTETEIKSSGHGNGYEDAQTWLAEQGRSGDEIAAAVESIDAPSDALINALTTVELEAQMGVAAWRDDAWTSEALTWLEGYDAGWRSALARALADRKTDSVRARNPRRSTCVDDDRARDVDLELVIGYRTVTGECTLLPACDDGELSRWGDLDHWLSGSLVEEVRRMPDSGRLDTLRRIESAARAVAE